MKFHRASVFVLGLALLAASCKNESADSAGAPGPIVARVGDREVTLSYYEDRIEKMERQFLPDTLDLAGKKEFLTFIINKELMAAKAEALGYAADQQVKSSLEFIENALVSQAALDQVTAGLDSVSDEDTRAFYENKKVQRLAMHIMTGTKQAADEVYNALLNGADFDSLADVHSIVPRVDSNGQPLPLSQRTAFGWVEYGQATPSVEQAIYDGPLNQPSAPVQTPYGWHVFYPLSTRDQRQPPYDEVQHLIRQQIVGRRKRAATEAYYDDVLEAKGFELDQEAVDLVYSKLPSDASQPQDPNFEVKPVIPFTHEERGMTIFDLDGKTYTVGDFSDRYDATSSSTRPKQFHGAIGIPRWIRDEWMKDLRLERAKADGIAELPSVANQIRMRREELMVGALHANLIQYQVPEPTEEELMAYYEDHPGHYVDHEKRSCNLIFHPRERVIRRAYQEIQEGADFVETAIRFNDSAVEAKDVRTAAFTRDDEQHADIAEIAFGLELEEYSEPFKVTSPANAGWFIVQLHHVIAEKPLEYENVEEFVRRDWRSEWSEKRLNELLEEWRADFAVEVFDDILASAEIRRDDVVVPGTSRRTAPEEPGAGDTN
jgi:parvulin-like peptidyl-prolyl isomerase